MVIETLPALLPQAASGKIRLLAVTTPTRRRIARAAHADRTGREGHSATTSAGAGWHAGRHRGQARHAKAAAMESVKQAAEARRRRHVAGRHPPHVAAGDRPWAEVVSAAMTAAPTRMTQAVDLAIIGGGSVGVSLLLQFLLSRRRAAAQLAAVRTAGAPGGAYQDDLRSNYSTFRPAICRRWRRAPGLRGWRRQIPPGWPATGWKARSIRAISCPAAVGAYMADAYERRARWRCRA